MNKVKYSSLRSDEGFPLSDFFPSDSDRQEIGKYAKNYLPLLFNLYTTEKWNHSRDPVRQSVFETIKRYLTITDRALCQTFFDKSLEKTANADLDQITL